MNQTFTAKRILGMRFETIRLGGGWDECVGEVEPRGIWFVWGNAGNGKTSAVVSLCKELAAHGKVLYNSREEGASLTMRNTLSRFSMGDLGCRFQLTDLPLGELSERLSQPKSPRFVVVDSFQYMGIGYREFQAFCARHRNKLLVFVSRADGKRPAGRAACSAMYDASLKIWVEGYKAFSKGRFIGSTGECVIWEEGAERYWNGRGSGSDAGEGGEI